MVYKIDQLSRSVVDFHTLMERFDASHVNFVSVTHGFDTSTAVGRLLRNILMDFAQLERELISERTKHKMLARAQKGLWNGGTPPYGYTCQDKQLVMDPGEAAVVRQMFDLYAATRSLAQVVDTINLQHRTRKRRRWAKSTVESILSNPIYAGKVSINEQMFDGTHEAIIPCDLFCTLGQLKKVRSHTLRIVDRVFTLKGLLTCAMCDSALTPSWVQKKNGKKILYYRCISTQLYKSRCPLGQFNTDRIEQPVEEKMTEMVNRQGFLEELIASINVETEEETGPLLEKNVAWNADCGRSTSRSRRILSYLGRRVVRFYL